MTNYRRIIYSLIKNSTNKNLNEIQINHLVFIRLYETELLVIFLRNVYDKIYITIQIIL